MCLAISFQILKICLLHLLRKILCFGCKIHSPVFEPVENTNLNKHEYLVIGSFRHFDKLNDRISTRSMTEVQPPDKKYVKKIK